MITDNLYLISAICGNFWQESTINPGIWENLTVGAPGYGLGQWTDNYETTRRTALFNWLDANGYDRDSGEGQLQFLIYENVWNKYGGGVESDFNTLEQFLNSGSTNIDYLTLEFMHHWEGIEDGTGQTRIQFAYEVYDYLINDDGVRFPWYSSNSYNETYKALDNSLLIMDFFLEESPTPPTPPEPPTDEEIFIILFRRKIKEKKQIFILH